jgi:hypothetical protein
LRRLWSKLIAGAISNPTTILAWMSEEIRLNDNRHHRTRSRAISGRGESLSEFLDDLDVQSRPSLEELVFFRAFYQQLARRVNDLYGYKGSGRPPSILAGGDAEALYSVVVGTRPSTVIETGVSDGVSTATVLLGLQRNGWGELHSIDYPKVGLPRLYGQQPGWVVPGELRSRWHLSAGRSVDLLSPLLERVGGCDLFLHDSEHSYSNMTFEFNLITGRARRGSIILADDAIANDAIFEARERIAEETTAVTVIGGRLGGFRVRSTLPCPGATS